MKNLSTGCVLVRPITLESMETASPAILMKSWSMEYVSARPISAEPMESVLLARQMNRCRTKFASAKPITSERMESAPFALKNLHQMEPTASVSQGCSWSTILVSVVIQIQSTMLMLKSVSAKVVSLEI